MKQTLYVGLVLSPLQGYLYVVDESQGVALLLMFRSFRAN